MLHQQYCLRWKYHHSNLQTMFSELLEREAFCDVGLVCEGRTIKAHKIVLCSCSTYFDNILSQYDEKYPIIIMQNVKFIDIKCLIEYMYKGEINVDHSNLPTLLKAAEELRIKGLAEVSWRDEDDTTSTSHQNETNGLPAVIPPVSTIMESPPYEHTSSSSTSCYKKKRNRDDYENSFTIPKVCHHHVSSSGNVSNVEDAYSNDAMSSSEHNLQIWEDDQQNDMTDNEEQPPMKIKKELNLVDDQDDHSNTSFSSSKLINNYTTTSSISNSSQLLTLGGNSNQSYLTASIEQEWPDVIKMNEYLNTGRRQQFWEEPFTKRIMDAIKNKTLEMKVAAELLGVSYGTLYGRYRDSYGCLKHPYRVVRELGNDPNVSNDIASMLKKNEISCTKAVELLNSTPQGLSNYRTNLPTKMGENPDLNSSTQLFHGESCDDSTTDDDESDTILPDNVNNNSNDVTNTKKQNVVSDATGQSLLANCENLSVIKNEDNIKINNNSDHSDSSCDGK